METQRRPAVARTKPHKWILGETEIEANISIFQKKCTGSIKFLQCTIEFAIKTTWSSRVRRLLPAKCWRQLIVSKYRGMTVIIDEVVSDAIAAAEWLAGRGKGGRMAFLDKWVNLTVTSWEDGWWGSHNDWAAIWNWPLWLVARTQECKARDRNTRERWKPKGTKMKSRC